MESVSNGHVESQDNAGSQLGQKCLRIPHILRQILEHFSDSELLQLSLVNKQWNYEARSVIKNRGSKNAHLHLFGSCKEVAVFASHVHQMNVVPYSGICIYFDRHAPEEPCSSEALDSSIDVILNRLPFKHFGIIFNGQWEEFKECPALLLVKKVIQDYCGILENLSIRFRSDFDEFIHQTIRHSTFPRLARLKLRNVSRRIETHVSADVPMARWMSGLNHGGNAEMCTDRKVIRTIVSHAPNMQELHLDHPVERFEELLHGSSGVLVFDSEVDPGYVNMPDALYSTLRLTRMRLVYKSGFSPQRFERIVPVVLQTSRLTLRRLSLDVIITWFLVRWGIRLENVTKLAMHLDRVFIRPGQDLHVKGFLKLLQRLDFAHIFPKLDKVEMFSSRLSPQEISQLVEHGNFILEEPSPDRDVNNIKHLKLRRFPIHVPILARIFPRIKTLEIENWMGPAAPPFGLIWEHWVHLKQLVVNAQDIWQQDWESLFCGLFPEEIAELREKDDDYLKAVNIVPVMPSITSMKDLTSFTLCNTENGFDDRDNDPTLVLSKVTGLIAFRRCPNLSVTLKINSQNAWSHMKNYASIIVLVEEPRNVNSQPSPIALSGELW